MAGNTMLQELLRYPHAAVFDKAPGAELAMRVRHPAGATWSIADDVMVAAAGSATFTYDLGALTVGQLAAALTSDGFDVSSVSHEFLGLSAKVLIEGDGDQGRSNGDQLPAFTSLLYSLFGGYAGELRTARTAIVEALKQMVVTTSEGEWLDLWGTLYGVPRSASESDADFSVRIPEEAFRIRVNALAIEDAVFDQTGYRIVIEEPWRRLFRSSVSPLSGDHYLYDGARYGSHLIQPVARGPIDWAAVMPVIDRNRAAGVLMLDPVIDLPAWHLSFNIDPGCASFSRSDTRGCHALQESGDLLDVTMALSDYEIILNYQAAIGQYVSVRSEVGAKDYQQMTPSVAMARASFRLSDGEPLGSLNTRFATGTVEIINGDEHLSGGTELGEDGYKLSDVHHMVVETPIDAIEEQTHTAHIVWPDTIGFSLSMQVQIGKLGSVPEARWSDMALSDYTSDLPLHSGLVQVQHCDANLNITSVECPVIRIETRGYSAERIGLGSVISLIRTEHATWASRLPDSAYWRGEWDARRWDGGAFGAAMSQTIRPDGS